MNPIKIITTYLSKIHFRISINSKMRLTFLRYNLISVNSKKILHEHLYAILCANSDDRLHYRNKCVRGMSFYELTTGMLNFASNQSVLLYCFTGYYRLISCSTLRSSYHTVFLDLVCPDWVLSMSFTVFALSSIRPTPFFLPPVCLPCVCSKLTALNTSTECSV